MWAHIHAHIHTHINLALTVVIWNSSYTSLAMSWVCGCDEVRSRSQNDGHDTWWLSTHSTHPAVCRHFLTRPANNARERRLLPTTTRIPTTIPVQRWLVASSTLLFLSTTLLYSSQWYSWERTMSCTTSDMNEKSSRLVLWNRGNTQTISSLLRRHFFVLASKFRLSQAEKDKALASWNILWITCLIPKLYRAETRNPGKASHFLKFLLYKLVSRM